MFTYARVALLALLLLSGSAVASSFDYYVGIGREATPDEVTAWDIDVRPDFVGLPRGRGTVDEGEELWEQQCAFCHGTFGESNEVFTPLIGGTTAEDIQSGRVRALAERSFPQRTTMMKAPTVATLFDYIRRAMPWTSPKSLSDDEVYAVLAYMLNLAGIVPMDYVLDEETIREVQQRMPNRNGMTTDHGLWPGASAAEGGIGNGGVPDVKNVVCMEHCKENVEVLSEMPDHARGSHGDLAAQNRLIGPVRGQQTLDPAQREAAAENPVIEGEQTARAGGCMICHGLEERIVGPGFAEIAVRYSEKEDAADYLVGRIRQGSTGVWGSTPMPPQTQLKDEELAQLVHWILSGAPTQ
ncbi:MAG TPA: c-type cytochrome [Azoarcus sp.]|nr:c-type cytochrome [Azoarcus sp.]